jgi:hypothetical protein
VAISSGLVTYPLGFTRVWESPGVHTSQPVDLTSNTGCRTCSCLSFNRCFLAMRPQLVMACRACQSTPSLQSNQA